MLCEKCGKNEATVMYKESINGKKSSYALCSECASQMGVFENAKKFASDPFENMNSLFGTLFGLSPYKNHSTVEEKKCGLCGATFRELAADGMVGCPNCYREFSDELSTTIAKIHGSSHHTGSAPSEFAANREKKREIANTEKALKEAIAAEEYEKAAQLRDKLRELKKDNGGEK